MKYLSNKLAQFKQWILSIVIKRSSTKKLTGRKGVEKCYPKYAPHIILGTNKSILDVDAWCDKNGYYRGNYWFPNKNDL